MKDINHKIHSIELVRDKRVVPVKATKTVNGEKQEEIKEVTIFQNEEGIGDIGREFDLRKVLGLPTTKDLVYYPDSSKNEKYLVPKYTITKMYEEWYELTIYPVGLSPVVIHNSHFAEMQSPTFIEDQKKLVGEEI